ncbi:hypothetical protein CLF_100572 [Clonorchis sinensis]|uniref:Uncharacterized protein n=1 Tax=Clonorchis sinensis TaxID=79923 RepID=G7Y3R8_CLOSI|nr:hypothetical protein CLF_100572 [Clonorchis sinensis]
MFDRAEDHLLQDFCLRFICARCDEGMSRTQKFTDVFRHGYNGVVKAFSLDACQRDPCRIRKNGTVQFKMEFVTSLIGVYFGYTMKDCDNHLHQPQKNRYRLNSDDWIKLRTLRSRSISPEYSIEQTLLGNQPNNRIGKTVSSDDMIRTVLKFFDKIMTSYKAEVVIREESCAPNFHSVLVQGGEYVNVWYYSGAVCFKQGSRNQTLIAIVGAEQL